MRLYRHSMVVDFRSRPRLVTLWLNSTTQAWLVRMTARDVLTKNLTLVNWPDLDLSYRRRSRSVPVANE